MLRRTLLAFLLVPWPSIHSEAFEIKVIRDSGPIQAVLLDRERFTKENLIHISKKLIETGKPYKVYKILFVIAEEDLIRSAGPSSTEQTFDDWLQEYKMAAASPYPMAETLVLGDFIVMRWRGLDLTLHAHRSIRPNKLESPLVFKIQGSRAEIVHVDLRETPSVAFKTTFYVQSGAQLDISYARSLFSALSERFNLGPFAMVLGNQAMFFEDLGYPLFNNLVPGIPEQFLHLGAQSNIILCSRVGSDTNCSMTDPGEKN